MAVVAAAGSASRYGKAKLYEPLAGDTVIGHALRALLANPAIRRIVVAIAAHDSNWHKLPQAGSDRLSAASGGATRAQSVLNALNALQADADDWVLVHDAARPCLHAEDLNKLLRHANGTGHGALLAAPLHDTIKSTQQGKLLVQRTMCRDSLWRALTPQLFRHAALHAAISAAIKAGHNPADEAEAMERAGVMPELVPGRSDNIKITCREDLALAEAVLAQRCA